MSSNHNESNWFDDSMPLNSSTEGSEVILIDDDDDDDDSNCNGLNNGNSKSNVMFGHRVNEQKIYSCDICHSKLSSSYNLKRHMMIHTGE